MIREPYNITPYNSTIDTSRINEFGFTFSGDELGSWQAEVAKNNSSPEVLFTSKQYYPADAGYDRIFDGDRVEGTLVPSWIKATNSGKYDGEVLKLYDVTGTPRTGNRVKVFIQKKTGENKYETIAVGQRKTADDNTYYVAFDSQYVLGTSSEGSDYYVSFQVDSIPATEPTSATFSFVGYLLIADNKDSRINFTSDDAIQIENMVFVPPIDGVGTGDYLEFYLLHQQGKEQVANNTTTYEMPDYIPTDEYVTYYIFTYNGTEEDTYSGEEINIDDIISGQVENLTVQVDPYQEGKFWGPGMGVNKFEVGSTNWSKSDISCATQGLIGSRFKGACSWDYSSTTFSFTVTATQNASAGTWGTGSYQLIFLFSNSPKNSIGSISNAYLFPFKDGEEVGENNYVLGYNIQTPVGSTFEKPFLIFSDGTDYQKLEVESKAKFMTATSHELIGFGIIFSYGIVSANNTIQVSFHPLIATQTPVTKYSSYSNPYTFSPCESVTLTHTFGDDDSTQQVVIKPNNSDSDNLFYGGLMSIEPGNNGNIVTAKRYSYIERYINNRDYRQLNRSIDEPRDNNDVIIDSPDLSNYRWWSSFEPYRAGTNPSDGAFVIYTELNDTTGSFNSGDNLNFYPLGSSNTFNALSSYGSGNSAPSQNSTFTQLQATQSPNKSTVALRENVGEDLIWRLRLWEPGSPAGITNFLKKSRLLQDASRISENTYEGEVNLNILENIELTSTSTNPVQIGDDLFIENKQGENELVVSIMPSILYTNLVEDMEIFANALNSQCVLEIDNYIFQITNTALSEDKSYITLTLKETDGLVNDLTIKSYYDYTIEFSSDISNNLKSLINNTVTKNIYTMPTISNPFVADVPQFNITVNNASPYHIVTTHYWLYSDGTPRAFYTLNNAIKGKIRGRDYRLYSNFYNSNWYFFQSRSTPELTITYSKEDGTIGTFPATNYAHRSIELNATYSQAENIGVKYHTWQIDKYEGDEVVTVFQSNERYNSDFNCIFDSLDSNGMYTVTFTVVNQEGVVASIASNLTTNFAISEIDSAECTAIVDNNAHLAEVTWMNGLTSEPDEGKSESIDFDNHIGVGPTEQDITINNKLTYSTIAGAPININGEDLSFQAGFVINDDAKVDGKNEEFYNSTFLKIIGKGASSSSLSFDKLGLDVDIKEDSPTIDWKLLDDISGQVDSDTHSNTNFFMGKNYIWDDDENWTDDGFIWTETQSDTNCYYYQIVGGYTQEIEETEIEEIENEESEVEEAPKVFELKVQRTPFSHLIPSENYPYSVSGNTHTLTIPYNPLFDVEKTSSSPSLYPLWVKLYDGIDGTEKSIHQVSNIGFDSENSPKTKMILTLEPDSPNNQWPVSTVTEAVVYGSSEQVPGSPVSVSLPERITSFVLGPKTWFFYFTVYDGSKGTLPVNITPPAFGEKPDWNSTETMILNVKFNGTNISSKQAEITSSVDTYKVYRIKYRRISNKEAEDEIIYRRLIGEFSLTQEELTSVPKFRFIDWAIENKGIFSYEIVPSSSENGITEATIKCNNKIITDWYGWSFTEISKFRDTWHYEPIERWLFKLNIETNGYSHQTNKVFDQGFNRYPKASIGTTNYITTNLSCLIGDIRKELQKVTYYAKQQGYARDTIETIQAWEDFSNTSNMILIKDYKGRAFIGVIDGNAMSFQDVVVDILTNLSFNVTQIDDVANYQIFSVEEG